MPLQTFNYAAIPPQVDDWSNLGNLFGNYYKGYEMGQTPQRLKQEQLAKDLQNKLLGEQAKYYGPKAEADIDLARQHADYYKSRGANVGGGNGGYAPSNLGKLVQERESLAEKDPNNPLIAEYDRVIKSQSGAKQFAPTGIGKLYNELQQVDEGYLPGSNGAIELDPEQQQELRNRYLMQIQKNTTDQPTRTTVLRGQNLLKSIDASNIDDLTRYSGLRGALSLKAEQTKDLTGNPSEEYLKYLEAQQAVKLEAKELRQFFGDSITPDAANALYDMVNATSLTKSPEAAKRMIEKSRATIKKQVDTFEKALHSSEAYGGVNPDQFAQTVNAQNDPFGWRK